MIKISHFKIKKFMLAMLVAIISAIFSGFVLYIYTFRSRFFYII
jgi:hypothetical protein